MKIKGVNVHGQMPESHPVGLEDSEDASRVQYEPP